MASVLWEAGSTVSGEQRLNTHGLSIGVVVDALRFLYHPTPKAVHRKYHGK